MTKIDIISGFLGAGKTTLIKKLLSDAYKGEQVVLDRKSTRLNSSHNNQSRMPSSA